MKEFVEKLISRLEELNQSQIEKYTESLCEGNLDCVYDKTDIEDTKVKTTYEIIQIVNQLAEEYIPCHKPCTGCEAYDLVRNHCPKFCKIIKETVREFEENHNGWIPCSERLPERNKPVLCWVKSTTIASGETFIIGSCDHKCWFLQTYEIGHHHFPVKDYEVIAWQPLPDPYIPEE